MRVRILLDCIVVVGNCRLNLLTRRRLLWNHSSIAHFSHNLVNLGLTEKLGEGNGCCHRLLILLGWLWLLVVHMVGHVSIGVPKGSDIERWQLLAEEAFARWKFEIMSGSTYRRLLTRLHHIVRFWRWGELRMTILQLNLIWLLIELLCRAEGRLWRRYTVEGWDAVAALAHHL